MPLAMAFIGNPVFSAHSASATGILRTFNYSCGISWNVKGCVIQAINFFSLSFILAAFEIFCP